MILSCFILRGFKYILILLCPNNHITRPNMPPSRDYSWLLRNDYTRATASEEAPLSTKRKRAAGGQNDHASSFEYTITPDAAKSAKRRRTRLAAASGRHDVIDLTESEPQQPGPSTPKRKRKQAQRTPGSGESIEEKRLRMFRDHPPQTFEVKLQRARTQRLAGILLHYHFHADYDLGSDRLH